MLFCVVGLVLFSFVSITQVIGWKIVSEMSYSGSIMLLVSTQHSTSFTWCGEFDAEF